LGATPISRSPTTSEHLAQVSWPKQFFTTGGCPTEAQSIFLMAASSRLGILLQIRVTALWRSLGALFGLVMVRFSV
jgi:hypothetical protein